MTTILGILLGLILSPVGIAIGGAAGRGELSQWGRVLMQCAVIGTFALFATTARAAGGRELAVYVSWR
jgi:hypothetical protein